MPTRITSRLAAHAGTRQVDAVLYADAAADAADRAIGAGWRKLLGLLASTSNPWEAQRAAQVLAGEFGLLAHAAIDGGLRRLAVWGYRTAAANVARTLPLDWLAAAAVQRMPLRESVQLLEDDADPSITGLIGGGRPGRP